MNPEKFIGFDDTENLLLLLRKFASEYLTPKEQRDALESAGIDKKFLSNHAETHAGT